MTAADNSWSKQSQSFCRRPSQVSTLILRNKNIKENFKQYNTLWRCTTTYRQIEIGKRLVGSLNITINWRLFNACVRVVQFTNACINERQNYMLLYKLILYKLQTLAKLLCCNWSAFTNYANNSRKRTVAYAAEAATQWLCNLNLGWNGRVTKHVEIQTEYQAFLFVKTRETARPVARI